MLSSFQPHKHFVHTYFGCCLFLGRYPLIFFSPSKNGVKTEHLEQTDFSFKSIILIINEHLIVETSSLIVIYSRIYLSPC